MASGYTSSRMQQLEQLKQQLLAQLQTMDQTGQGSTEKGASQGGQASQSKNSPLGDLLKALAAKEGTKQAVKQGTSYLGGGSILSGNAAMGSTPFYIPAAVILQTALSGKSGYNMLRGKAKRIDQMRMKDITSDPLGTIGRVGLGVATNGLSEVANSFLSHKSTKDYQKERRKNLGERGITGYANFEEQSKANKDIVRDADAPESAYDYISSLGMYETFGDDWDKLNTEEKAKVVKGLMDANLLRNDHGDTLIWHGLGEGGEQAKDIFSKVMKGELQTDPGENPYKRKGQTEDKESYEPSWIKREAEALSSFPIWKNPKKVEDWGTDMQYEGTVKEGNSADYSQKPANYNQMSRAEKDAFWKKHKAYMAGEMPSSDWVEREQEAISRIPVSDKWKDSKKVEDKGSLPEGVNPADAILYALNKNEIRSLDRIPVTQATKGTQMPEWLAVAQEQVERAAGSDNKKWLAVAQEQVKKPTTSSANNNLIPKAFDYRTKPENYDQLSRAEKDAFWKKHKEVMGA